jgi:hypothetical protein
MNIAANLDTIADQTTVHMPLVFFAVNMRVRVLAFDIAGPVPARIQHGPPAAHDRPVLY